MGVKKLTCESRVVKNGKRIRVVEATIYGDNGQEISRSLLEYMDMQREMIIKK
jgi:acyl-CoA thioesterase